MVKFLMMDEHQFSNLIKLDKNHWWFQVRYRYAASLIPHKFKENQLLLDWGCGAGGFLSSLLDQHKIPYSNILGYEPSLLMQDILKQRGIPFVSTAQDLDPVALNNKQLLAITLLDVLEHIKEPIEHLKYLNSLSQPGTKIIIFVPAFKHLWTKWDESLGHFRRYTRSSLIEEVESAGWIVQHSRYFFAPLYFPAILRRALFRFNFFGNNDFPGANPFINQLLKWVLYKELSIPNVGFGTSIALVAISERQLDLKNSLRYNL